jgi:two-component system, NarL family, nitrate/nitrite response regulator NarL
MNPPGSEAVLVVDDHPLFGRGVAMLVRDELRRPAVLEGSVEAALERLAAGEAFALVMLDLELPGLSGLEGVQRVRALRPKLPVVVCSSHQGELARQAAIERGAHAFVHKGEPPERLLAAMRSALAGVPGEAAGAGQGSAMLTTRQREVLWLLSEGKSNKVIARALDMSENTVRNHVAAILDRLGVQNRHAAAAEAQRLGLMPPTERA